MTRPRHAVRVLSIGRCTLRDREPHSSWSVGGPGLGLEAAVEAEAGLEGEELQDVPQLVAEAWGGRPSEMTWGGEVVRGGGLRGLGEGVSDRRHRVLGRWGRGGGGHGKGRRWEGEHCGQGGEEDPDRDLLHPLPGRGPLQEGSGWRSCVILCGCSPEESVRHVIEKKGEKRRVHSKAINVCYVQKC